MPQVDQALVNRIADGIVAGLDGTPSGWLEAVANGLLDTAEAGGEHEETLRALSAELMDRANGVG